MIVALYARVSTNDKDQKPETQLRILRAYVAEKGWQVYGEPYVDEGFSGKDAERPAFKRLLADARTNRFQAIVALRMDRYMRSSRHALNVAEEMRQLGIDLVFTAQDMDTTTPMGKFIFTVSAAFAELDRAIISQRVSEGIARHIAEGGKWGKGRRKDIPLGVVEELLRSKPFYSVAEVAEALGVPRTTLLDHVKRAGKRFDAPGDPTQTHRRLVLVADGSPSVIRQSTSGNGDGLPGSENRGGA